MYTPVKFNAALQKWLEGYFPCKRWLLFRVHGNFSGNFLGVKTPEGFVKYPSIRHTKPTKKNI